MDNLACTIDAAPDRVWEILADFGNIYRWNPSVKHSHLTSEATAGPGTGRHCDLGYAGLDEVVTAWEPGETLAIAVTGTGPNPVATAAVTFRLEPAGAEQTTVALDIDYSARGGAVGRLMAPMVDTQLSKGMRALLAGLKEYAETGRTDLRARDLPLNAVRVA